MQNLPSPSSPQPLNKTALNGITMVIRSLTGGGAEHVMSLMGAYWVEHGVRVSLITCAPLESDAYKVSPLIKRLDLSLKKPNFFSRLGFPWSLRQLRKAIKGEGNEVVLSFMDRSNIPVLMATRGLGVKVIVAERIDPRPQNRSLINRLLVHIFYPMADAVTVLTANVKKDWAEKFIPAKKIHVIHNPVRQRDEYAPPPEWLPQKFICCMGRLHPQKAFERFFPILPYIFQQFPEYKLVILGEGVQRAELEAQLAELGLTDKVLLPGFVKAPHNIMQQADLFVLASRYEGFPNALLEAMSLGLPCVSFDCNSGPRDIITPGVDGVLVPEGNMHALQQEIITLLNNPAQRARLGKAAQGKILSNCSLPTIMQTWESLFQQVLSGKPASPISTHMQAQASPPASSTAISAQVADTPQAGNQ